MAVAAPPKPRYPTISDVLARVGDIPPERILNHPEPGTATEQDVLDLDDHEDILCELVDGVLVRKPVGYEESMIAAALIQFLGEYLHKTGLGGIAGEGGMLKLARGLVRIPDVSVLLWNLLPDGKIPQGRVPELGPHLAVEVLSDSNTVGEMERKRKEYFAAGTRLVWIIDPPTRTIEAYSSPEQFTLLTESDTLDGADLLPGFSLSIQTLFERASVRRKP